MVGTNIASVKLATIPDGTYRRFQRKFGLAIGVFRMTTKRQIGKTTKPGVERGLYEPLATPDEEVGGNTAEWNSVKGQISVIA